MNPDDRSETGRFGATVIIPTKNRKQLLQDTVRSVLGQTVKVEVLIMDDGSTDGTCEFIGDAFPKERFPMVTIHRGERSRGPTFRRNQGAELASTPFPFTIDDDCTVPSPDTFQQTIDAFNSPRIGAVTIPFINIRQDNKKHFAAPDRDHRYVSFMYFGGMIAFRRDAYLVVGGYRTFYFMHVEEPDLSIRLYDNGYVIRLGSADPIHHLESPIRNQKRLYSLGPRNFMLYEWYNAPTPALLYRLPIAVFTTVFYTFKVRVPHLGIWGFLRGVEGIFHEWKKRAPVRPEVYRLARRLRTMSVKLEELPLDFETSKTDCMGSP